MNFGGNGAIGHSVTSVQTPPCCGALEDRLDDAVGAVAVFERGERRRQRRDTVGPAAMNAVDVAHHVAEGVGPRLLMPAGQMRVAARVSSRSDGSFCSISFARSRCPIQSSF